MSLKYVSLIRRLPMKIYKVQLIHEIYGDGGEWFFRVFGEYSQVKLFKYKWLKNSQAKVTQLVEAPRLL